MPALSNPRHEAFAQAIFAGLGGKTRKERAASTAYLTAYPSCSPGPSAEVNASRLLRKAKPIFDRVRELQAAQAKRIQPKIDVSRERLARRLDKASELAEAQDNPQGMVSAEMGIAKVFGHISDTPQQSQSFAEATSMTDIGRKLLLSVGIPEPHDAALIAEALEAKDAFIDRLKSLRDRASTTIDA
jgi:hypothetical protein